MFTGLVEGTGRVLGIEGERLRVQCPSSIWSQEPLSIGESVAINGTCLTVVEIDGETLGFDVSRETLNRTALGALKSGSKINLERAAKLGSRLGGHLVQGHVDTTGKYLGFEPFGESYIVRFQLEPAHQKYLIDKGSIAIDGISLTVVEPEVGQFKVWIIPHTWQETNLGELEPGSPVNIEFDVVAKYIENLVKFKL